VEELWTPWRMPYIVANKRATGCVFCSLLQDGKTDLVLARGPATFTVLNLYPYAVGHLMVIPYRHLSRMAALSPAESMEMAAALKRAEGILRRVSGATHFHAGWNLGKAAGAGVEGHLHAHLVPRGTTWQAGAHGDPVLGLSVPETFKRLRPAFSSG